MNYVFYVLIILAAVYTIFHIGDAFKWWTKVVLAVPIKIWDAIKKIFGK